MHETFYGLPHDVKFCKKCTISNQRPNSTVEFKNKNKKKETIVFDEDGVCSACNFHSVKEGTDWKAREEELFKILEPFRKNNGEYDVIVPSSGGKDSSFTAHVLKYKYGMNPLTVTWAPHMYTKVGWKNQMSLAHTGGIDNILYTPNGRLHSLATKLAFMNLGHPFQPFIHGQRIIGPSMAEKFGVNLIMYGENQAEYGNKVEENGSPLMSADYFTAESPEDIYLGGMKIRDIMKEYDFKYEDFGAYLPLTKARVHKANTQVLYLGYFEKWDPQECYYYAAENTGFSAAPQRSPGTYSKYAEIDDKLIPYHFYTTYIKFGIGRTSYDASQEIRNDKITRDEGIKLVEKFDHEFPEMFHEDFLEYIDITHEEFEKKIDSMRSPHLWTQVGGEWKLRHNIMGTGVNDLN